MWQRLSKLLIPIGSVGLVILTITNMYISRLSDQTAQSLLTSKDTQLEIVQKRLTTTQDLLVKKQSEIDIQRAELAKANQELTAKLKELDVANKKINSQESQIATNASELAKLRTRPPLFNFNVRAKQLANADGKKTDIEKLVTDSYDVIVDIYGLPYLLHSVTIELVDSLNNPSAAAETQISNGPNGLSLIVRLKDFDRTSFNDISSLIHELIHTFHGLSTLVPVAYEEGITIAATDAVLKQLINKGKVPNFQPLYIRTSSHGYQVSPISIPANDALFYSSSDVVEYYQLAGYGWYQLYASDNEFFKKFNEKIYSAKRGGTEITPSLVLNSIESSVLTSVGGQPISSWLKTKAFALE